MLKLFEQFDAPDYVIRVAHIALDLAPPSDPNIVSIRRLLHRQFEWHRKYDMVRQRRLRGFIDVSSRRVTGFQRRAKRF